MSLGFPSLFELVMLSALLRLDFWGVGKGVSSSPHCWCCHDNAVYRSLVLIVMAQLIQSEVVNDNGPLLLFYVAMQFYSCICQETLLKFVCKVYKNPVFS